MALGKRDEKLNIKNTDTMNKKGIKICDECGSEFLVGSSKMMGLCPECASVLYGYENCKHIFHQGRCVKCLWKGNKSEYVKRLEDFK